MPRSKNLREYLVERLKDPKQAAMYFEAILEETKDCEEEEARRLILSALKDIAEAQGGITKLAKKTKISRQNITKTFSATGNPKLRIIITIKDALLPAYSSKK